MAITYRELLQTEKSRSWPKWLILPEIFLPLLGLSDLSYLSFKIMLYVDPHSSQRNTHQLFCLSLISGLSGLEQFWKMFFLIRKWSTLTAGKCSVLTGGEKSSHEHFCWNSASWLHEVWAKLSLRKILEISIESFTLHVTPWSHLLHLDQDPQAYICRFDRGHILPILNPLYLFIKITIIWAKRKITEYFISYNSTYINYTGMFL